MLEKLTTEARNPASTSVDRMSSLEIVELMNQEDAKIAAAVGEELPHVAAAVDVIVERMHGGGRLIYIGAGTSVGWESWMPRSAPQPLIPRQNWWSASSRVAREP